MSDDATFKIFGAKDAKSRFGELLDEALARPVGITKHDRLTAYLVSRREFDAMRSKLAELEDQLWLARAEIARLEGFADEAEVKTFLSNFAGSADEKA